MKDDAKLKLDNQLCFPMYLVAKQVITKYGEFLAPLDLTYTQYLVMMVLWEFHTIDMKSLGEKLFLDSSTLTPLINRLIQKGYVTKIRDKNDKRSVILKVEPLGIKVKEQALPIPQEIFNLVDLTKEETESLNKILQKIISKLSTSDRIKEE